MGKCFITVYNTAVDIVEIKECIYAHMANDRRLKMLLHLGPRMRTTSMYVVFILVGSCETCSNANV